MAKKTLRSYAARKIGSIDLRGLKSFVDYRGKQVKGIILYLGAEELAIDGFRILPLAQGLQAIFE